MISRKENLFVLPIQQKRYTNHRHKVKSALPRIDDKPPEERKHVTYKQKKLQSEMERCLKIEKDNFILLRHLSEIHQIKRVDNQWLQKQPTFLHRVRLFHISEPKWDREAENFLQEQTSKGKSRKDRCVACNPQNFMNLKNENINEKVDKTGKKKQTGAEKYYTANNILRTNQTTKQENIVKYKTTDDKRTEKAYYYSNGGRPVCLKENRISSKEGPLTVIMNFPATTRVTLSANALNNGEELLNQSYSNVTSPRTESRNMNSTYTLPEINL